MGFIVNKWCNTVHFLYLYDIIHTTKIMKLFNVQTCMNSRIDDEHCRNMCYKVSFVQYVKEDYRQFHYVWI